MSSLPRTCRRGVSNDRGFASRWQETPSSRFFSSLGRYDTSDSLHLDVQSLGSTRVHSCEGRPQIGSSFFVSAGHLLPDDYSPDDYSPDDYTHMRLCLLEPNQETVVCTL
jgi:hypothetical protein